MHELSIACSIVETVEEHLPDERARATRIFLKIGAMSGVVRDALLFSFDIAAEGTRSAGSELVIEELPVVIYCPDCDRETSLGSLPVFRCGGCGELTGTVRQGKELEIASIEIEDGTAENS